MREPGEDEDELPPAPGSLAARAVRLTVEDLRADPPRREYLLRTAGGAGVFPRGRVGLLAARGGSGKTIVLMQAALAVATGSALFGSGGWRATEGRVLLLLGEEDPAEVQRRLHFAAKAARLDSDESLAAIADRVTALALAGVGVALAGALDRDTGDLPETPRANEIREILRAAVVEGKPYVLIVCDPLARFSATDTEKDNGLATRLVQIFETFTGPDCGAPSVIVAHHHRKAAKGDDIESADPIRGASALVDGARWAATLTATKRLEGAPDLVSLRVVKTNYAPAPDPLLLCRAPEDHGCLRVATPGERAAYDAAVPKRTARGGRVSSDDAGSAALEVLVLKALAEKPRTGAALAAALHVKKSLVCDACRALEEAGQIRRLTGSHSPWTLTDRIVPGNVPGTIVPGPEEKEPAPPFRVGGNDPLFDPLSTGNDPPTGGAPCGR